MALQMSLDTYLRKWFPVFYARVLDRSVDRDECMAMINQYGDCATQYNDEWSKAGIHPFNGAMMYLLTHEYPFCKECRDVRQADGDLRFHYPEDWVIENYRHFKQHMPHPITPLKQTKLKTETQRGNCMATALAILTNKPIADVPPLETLGEHWHQPFFKWLREIGYSYTPTKNPTGLSIANGMSSRNIMHSVIALDGEFFHDPHPSDDYLETVSQYWQIQPKVEVI